MVGFYCLLGFIMGLNGMAVATFFSRLNGFAQIFIAVVYAGLSGLGFLTLVKYLYILASGKKQKEEEHR
jgi:positive regulator of sigma E activity